MEIISFPDKRTASRRIRDKERGLSEAGANTWSFEIFPRYASTANNRGP